MRACVFASCPLGPGGARPRVLSGHTERIYCDNGSELYRDRRRPNSLNQAIAAWG